MTPIEEADIACTGGGATKPPPACEWRPKTAPFVVNMFVKMSKTLGASLESELPKKPFETESKDVCVCVMV